MTLSTSASEDLRSRTGEPGQLEFEAEAVPGIVILWDPAVPHRCAGFHGRVPDAETEQVRAALLGAAPVGERSQAPGQPRIDAGQWLRLAAVTTFDRLLHLPLDPALLGAEVAAVRFDAASTLPPHGRISEQLTSDALYGARRASRGVVQYLDRLARAGRRLPPVLEAALDRLVDCYAALAKEVGEPDEELAAVAEAWQRLSMVDGEPVVLAAAPFRRPAPDARGGVDVVDPRQIPARVLRLGSTAGTPEIVVAPTRLGERPAVRVRVAAFRDEPVAGDVVDLRVRVLAGRVVAERLLEGPVIRPPRSYGMAAERCYEAVVVLPAGVRAEEVRVDVADAARPPAEPAEVRRRRRAVLFLAQWRALAADVRLGTAGSPSARLHEIARRLAPGGGRAGAPLWAGGPSVEALRGLADLGDPDLAALLSGDAGSVPGEMVRGPGDLLVAEVAAAYHRSAT